MKYLPPYLLSYVVLLFGATTLSVYSHSTLHAMHDNHYYQPSTSFIHLTGVRKGDNAPGIKDVKSYLHRFGYLNNLDYNTNDVINADRFDESLERALILYQNFFKLNKTGVLDNETISLMSKPRCGNPDIFNDVTSDTKHVHGNFSRHYRFFRGRPHRTKDHLYVVFKKSVPSNLIEAIARGFADWEPYVPLVFLRTLEPGGVVPDIRVEFFRREHGDGVPFDGPGGQIAHASNGVGSILHFDLDENWKIGGVPRAMDIVTTARHEVGHLLGLEHSDVPSALMYPVYITGTVKNIADDDIAGIRNLYFGQKM